MGPVRDCLGDSPGRSSGSIPPPLQRPPAIKRRNRGNSPAFARARCSLARLPPSKYFQEEVRPWEPPPPAPRLTPAPGTPHPRLPGLLPLPVPHPWPGPPCTVLDILKYT